MTSKGIGDVRRVLGQPQAWIDQNFTRPQPALPAVDDELYRFVASQVTSWESQVAIEAREYQAGTNAAAVLRWAHDIRRQCAAVQRILVRYAETTQAATSEQPQLRGVLADLATSFTDHPDWRGDWGEGGASPEVDQASAQRSPS